MKTHPPGTRIAGRYEIAGRPLMGGMGIVYLCLDTETDRPVALKTFRPKLLPDRAARDRFLREGTAWVDMGAHPHVVRCYRVLRIDPEVFLVLELIAKEQGHDDASLRSWLTPGQPLPVEQALLFALQITRGMKHATETIPGFIHRDLKPENVLVGADHLSSANLPGAGVNRLRVTDFGLAAVLESASERVSESAMRDTEHAIRNTHLTHGIVGTPLYMAPEQWQGQPTTVATDVYALGCILYEMLAGQRAVSGHSLTALQRVHCEGDLRPLPESLTPTVSQIVARCLALEPGERYTAWDQAEAALTAAYEESVGHPAPAAEPVAVLSRAERVAAGWSYSAMGASYLDLGKAEVAAGYFERAHAVGVDEEERQLEAAGLTHLGLAYADLGDARRAVGYYEQALEIDREIGDRRGEGADLGNLGGAYLQLGDSQRAIECFEQALVIDRQIGDQRGEGNTLGNLGIAYFQLGDARRAIGYYEEGLNINREIGDRHREGKSLCNLGNAYAVLGDARRAIGLLEQYLEITREIGDLRGEGIALGNLGSACLQLGDARRAIGFYEQQLVTTREIDDRHGEGAALGNLGIAHLQLGDARRAIGFYEQCLTIHREIGDRRGEGTVLGNLGIAHFQVGDARRAIGLYEKRLEIAREIGDRRGEGNALGNLGLAYAALDDARCAIGFYEQCLTIHREIGDRRGEGTILGNLGIAYKNLGNTHRAIGYYEQALEIADEIGATDVTASLSFNIALLYAQQGETSRALELAQDAARIFAHIDRIQHAQRAQQLVAQLQGRTAPSGGSSPAQILQQIAPVIEAIVAAAHGHPQARAAVEELFDQFEQGSLPVVDPIQRIWAGERDEAALTAGIDPNSALIVREILKQLET